MFSLIESVRSAIHSIRAHAFRSFLTTLGIIIGVASVVGLISIMEGLTESVKSDFKGLGANSLTLTAETSQEDALQGRVRRLSLSDYALLTKHISDIRNVSPFFTPLIADGGTLRFNGRQAHTQVVAVTAPYQFVNQTFPQYGRFINEYDEQSRRKVVVIGKKLHKNLGLPANPVGSYVEIGREWFKVIGLTEVRGDSATTNRDDYALIPFSTGLQMAGATSQIDLSITFEVKRVEERDEVAQRITALLRQWHHLQPGEPNDFKIQTAQDLMKAYSQIILTLTLALGGIVSISLLVGGIGIMNIMLVSVTERTREIGICKALGAQKRDILMQFLVEATSLSLFGGMIGIAVGYLIGVLAASLIPSFPSASVPLWAIGLSFGFSTLVGVVFGIVPAIKAANLTPITALRYE